MTYVEANPGSPLPRADISINKNRVKKYGKDNDKIYLDHGTEFEIELTNPSTETYLAKIKINGDSIGSGLVLRPGEHIYLERFIDSPKKFLFETYEVDDVEEVRTAIKNNGVVEVTFHKERKRPIVRYFNNNLTNDFSFWNDNITYTSGNETLSYDPDSISSKATYDTNPLRSARSVEPNKMETGRVERGSESDQRFRFVNKEFNTWASNKVVYHIYPTSQKERTIDDVRVYCSNCGRRVRDGENYCPQCGKKN